MIYVSLVTEMGSYNGLAVLLNVHPFIICGKYKPDPVQPTGKEVNNSNDQAYQIFFPGILNIRSSVIISAPLAGMITNKFSSRIAIVTGGALATAGFTISSFAPSLDVIIVTMGFIVGEKSFLSQHERKKISRFGSLNFCFCLV